MTEENKMTAFEPSVGADEKQSWVKEGSQQCGKRSGYSAGNVGCGAG